MQDYFTVKTPYYPPIEAYHTGYLPVSDLHQIYYEEAGNPQGKPIVYVHGGPGGGIREDSRTYFDPDFYRIILFDQRGAGKSKPFAELRDNNTQALVADMEKLRDHLGVDRWHVFGGSWGSTLALVYAIMHPDRVTGLVLRGIFLGRQEDIDWSFRQGVDAFFPQEYEAYLAPLSEADRQNRNVVEGYYKLLTSEDQASRQEAAMAWSRWEGSLIKLIPDQALIAEFSNPQLALPLARLECHYFINQLFLGENYILANAHKLRDIPTIIVHGRYDMDCRLSAAYDLHRHLPQSDLRIIEASGHSSSEVKIGEALVEATNEARSW